MSELSHDPLEGNPKYRATRELGRGGMGEVFLGEHTSLGSKVVIKLLHAELSSREGLVDRMRLEAQALARLNHPNIVRVTDFDRTASGRPFFVMEYLPGKTLSDEVEGRGGFVPVAEALDITSQALNGLAAAHGAGLIHRDMKLDNLFVCDPSVTSSRAGQRVVKILDFGIAKVLDNAGGAPAPLMVPTSTGMVVGTPRFFAPEQARGKALDGRADIYAMGLVLYTLVAGRGPFDDASSITEMAKAHVLRKPDPPSRFAKQPVPAAVDQAVARAIAKKPDDRYQTAAEFAAVLQGILQQLGQAAAHGGASHAAGAAAGGYAGGGAAYGTGHGQHSGYAHSQQQTGAGQAGHSHAGQAHSHAGQAQAGHSHAGQAHSHAGQAQTGGHSHASQAGHSHAGQAHAGQAHAGQAHAGQAQSYTGRAHGHAGSQAGQAHAHAGASATGASHVGSSHVGQAQAGHAAGAVSQTAPSAMASSQAASQTAPSPMAPQHLGHTGGHGAGQPNTGQAMAPASGVAQSGAGGSTTGSNTAVPTTPLSESQSAPLAPTAPLPEQSQTPATGAPRASLSSIDPSSSLAASSTGQPSAGGQATGETNAVAPGRVPTAVAVVIVLLSALLGAASAMLYLRLVA